MWLDVGLWILLATWLPTLIPLVYGFEGTKVFHTPMHDILQNQLYLGTTAEDEIVVKYAGKGSDMKTNDYITHADGIRILSGGLDDFLNSGEGEVIVPVVDDDDVKHGGKRLIGFVMLRSVMPRKLSSRRGEIVFDMEEGGPAPSLKLGTDSSNYYSAYHVPYFYISNAAFNPLYYISSCHVTPPISFVSLVSFCCTAL
jgi:hypothetical protein